MMQFLESKGIHSHFSIPKKLWHNGAAESTIHSIMMIARTMMAESGLGGRFWFKAAAAQDSEKMPEISSLRSASE